MFQSQIINDVFANLGKDNATEIARALINQVGKVDVIDADGNSLLMHSIARKNQSLTAMLLSEGANPNLLNKELPKLYPKKISYLNLFILINLK